MLDAPTAEPLPKTDRFLIDHEDFPNFGPDKASDAAFAEREIPKTGNFIVTAPELKTAAEIVERRAQKDGSLPTSKVVEVEYVDTGGARVPVSTGV